MKRPETVDQYIAAAPQPLSQRLESLRQTIQAVAPQATEKISYGMPYYSLNGRLAYFCAFKNHIGFYPMKSAIKHFQVQLKDFETSAGTIRLPHDQPLPLELIKKIIQFRAQENLSKKN